MYKYVITFIVCGIVIYGMPKVLGWNDENFDEDAKILTYKVHVDRAGSEPRLVLDEFTAERVWRDGDELMYDTLSPSDFDSVEVSSGGMTNYVAYYTNDASVDRRFALVNLSLGGWVNMNSQERR